MDSQSLNEKLTAIKDTPYKYGNRMWSLKSWTVNEPEQEVTLISNGKPITKKFEALDYFIEMLQPIEENKLASVKDDTTMPELIMVLRDMLLDDIAKIREDRTYIGQAKAINNNITTVINLARLQLSLNKSGNQK